MRRHLFRLATLAAGLGGILVAAACGGGNGGNGAGDMAMAPSPDLNDGTGTGPAASLRCDSSGKNAWQTYGVNAFVAVNESIFTNVMSELNAHVTANLGDSFTKIGSGNPSSTADNLQTFKGELAAFLVYVYGGPTSITYTDGTKHSGPQDMVQAHTGLNITSAQYDYFVMNVVVPALTSNGVKHGAGGSADPNDVSSCFAPPLLNAAFKASIVGH